MKCKCGKSDLKKEDFYYHKGTEWKMSPLCKDCVKAKRKKRYREIESQKDKYFI